MKCAKAMQWNIIQPQGRRKIVSYTSIDTMPREVRQMLYYTYMRYQVQAGSQGSKHKGYGGGKEGQLGGCEDRATTCSNEQANSSQYHTYQPQNCYLKVTDFGDISQFPQKTNI